MSKLFHPGVIKAQLAFLNLSQAKLAKRAKLSNPRLSRLLTGKFKPRKDEVAKIGEAIASACAGEGLASITVVLKDQDASPLSCEAEAAGNGCVKIRLDDSHHFVSPAEAGAIADFIDDALDDLEQPRHSRR